MQVGLDKAGLTAARAVFVGDTVWDVEAAKRAGGVAIYDDVTALLREFDESPLAGLTTR